VCTHAAIHINVQLSHAIDNIVRLI